MEPLGKGPSQGPLVKKESELLLKRRRSLQAQTRSALAFVPTVEPPPNTGPAILAVFKGDIDV